MKAEKQGMRGNVEVKSVLLDGHLEVGSGDRGESKMIWDNLGELEDVSFALGSVFALAVFSKLPD